MTHRNIGGEYVKGTGPHPLAGLLVESPEIALVGSDKAHALIGREFSRIEVIGGDKMLLRCRIDFYVEQKDLPVLQAIKDEQDQRRAAQ